MRCSALTAKNRRCKNACLQGKQTCFNHTLFDAFECVVCHGDVTNNAQSYKLNCDHRFCKTCITNWIKHDKDTCPICRAIIPIHMIVDLVPDYYTRRAPIRIPISASGGVFSIERRLNNRAFITDLIATLEGHALTLPEE